MHTLEEVGGPAAEQGEGGVDVVGQAGPAAADGTWVAGLHPLLQQAAQPSVLGLRNILWGLKSKDLIGQTSSLN